MIPFGGVERGPGEGVDARDIAGMAGRDSCPTAGMRISAVRVSPPAVRTCQTPCRSSNSASVTSVPKRMRAGRSCLRATVRMYSWMSPCCEKRRGQSDFGSNDHEYSGEGTSQAAPG